VVGYLCHREQCAEEFWQEGKGDDRVEVAGVAATVLVVAIARIHPTITPGGGLAEDGSIVFLEPTLPPLSYTIHEWKSRLEGMGRGEQEVRGGTRGAEQMWWYVCETYLTVGRHVVVYRTCLTTAHLTIHLLTAHYSSYRDSLFILSRLTSRMNVSLRPYSQCAMKFSVQKRASECCFISPYGLKMWKRWSVGALQCRKQTRFKQGTCASKEKSPLTLALARR
jgi:hypothetical protein